MRRGEVRWYTFDSPDKRRPVLVLTRNSAIRFLNTLTIAPITTTVRNIPSEVLLGRDEGMPAACAANLDHIQTIPKSRIGPLITALTPSRMEEVEGAIAFALGFGDTEEFSS
jgi:mRNA interferase MazF